MPTRPKRSLGQNFLVDAGYRARIVDAARIGPGEAILEIGPGREALTVGLVEAVDAADGHLLLVELDDDLARDLSTKYEGHPRVRVIHGDVLEHPLERLAAGIGIPVEALKVVGNIPYNVTSPILFHLLERPRPTEILLMVQREVADRILADAGGRAYGALTVGVRAVAEVERVLQVPAGAFRPRPKVDSTVVRIVPLRPSPMRKSEEGALRELTRALFQWRRKQLGKILRDHPDLAGPEGPPADPDGIERLLSAAGVGASARPEEVPPEGFVRMARVWAAARA